MPTFNNKENKVKSNFSRISISLASPEDISARSCGEVLKPETVNYRTYKPERDGLFCEKIFGPTKDYECYCGKYKRIRYRGIVCDRCGVEVTEKKVRRERMGHISLTVPVAHIWYFKSAPNKISALLGLPAKKLESVIYYEKYIVVNPGQTGIEKMELLSEDEYLDQLAKFPDNNNLPDGDPDKFVAKMGAEGIYDLLKQIDVVELSKELRQSMFTETSQQRKTEILKRLSVVKWFLESKDINRPEWMIMKVIPVIPPDLRPLVPLDGGRFATTDLNDLYRRVIIRNNRLKKLIEIKAPEGFSATRSVCSRKLSTHCSTTPRSPALSRARPTGLSSPCPTPSKASRAASARTSSESVLTTQPVRLSSSDLSLICTSAVFLNSWPLSSTSRSSSAS